MSRTTRRLWAALAATAAVVCAVPVAQAAPPAAPGPPAGPAACGSRVNDTHALLAECITVAGVRKHQAALQRVADTHHGTRVSGSPGYDASVDYVVQQLKAAGYTPDVRAFTFTTFVSLRPAVLQRVAPAPAAPVANTILGYSGGGDVTAPLTGLRAAPVDVTPGCDVADYGGFPVGTVALVSRGGCTFATKAQNAYAAGAAAVVIANNVAGDLDGTLGEGFDLDIPVTSVTQAVGAELAATSGSVVHVATATSRGPATTYNVLAETSGGNDGNVVMAGAHLDSVNAGPGINDNGSGAAALLEVAEQLARVDPVNRVRFAWWGGGESTLVGATRYVTGLTDEERARIALYLNVDMIGSPNPVFFVHDGDDSDAVGAGPGPSGSDRIEKTFEAFFAQRRLPVKGTDLDGRSDYGPFLRAGIPSGGLFSGGDGIKTAQEAQAWGGTAGKPYDPCYHRACDTLTNVDLGALEVNTHALGFAVLQYAMNTSDINGVPGDVGFPAVSPTPAPGG